MLAEQELAPDFKLEGHDGSMHCLSDQQGKYAVVYFYPKDNTPGCTQQACDLRDNMAALTEHNVVVYGISKDSIKSHQTFQDKYQINFILLSDPELAVHQQFGATENEKTIRSTFLIGKKREVLKVWPKVKVNGHVQEILQVLAANP
jgi:peroxiredoxin Q/BCP